MNFTNLIESGTKIQIAITPENLKELAAEISIATSKQIIKEMGKKEQPVPEKEACKMFGKTRQTFSKYRKDGKIRYHQFGREIYYFPSELKEDMGNFKRQ
jgi:hypothetical protein